MSCTSWGAATADADESSVASAAVAIRVVATADATAADHGESGGLRASTTISQRVVVPFFQCQGLAIALGTAKWKSQCAQWELELEQDSETEKCPAEHQAFFETAPRIPRWLVVILLRIGWEGRVGPEHGKTWTKTTVELCFYRGLDSYCARLRNWELEST